MDMLAIPSSEMIDALRAAVDAAVGSVGGELARVSYGVDYDGDDCLNIVLRFTQPATALDLRIVAALDYELVAIAGRFDENRYVYIRREFPPGQVVAASWTKTRA